MDMESTLQVYNKAQIKDQPGVVQGQTLKPLIGIPEHPSERIRVGHAKFGPNLHEHLHWHPIEVFYYVLSGNAIVRDYAGKSISTDEFEKLTEKVSKQELTYFFAQWVHSTGVPLFKRTWSVYRTAKGYQVVGKVQQDIDIFRMPVEIRIFPEGRKAINERVEVVGTSADFAVTTPTRPLP